MFKLRKPKEWSKPVPIPPHTLPFLPEPIQMRFKTKYRIILCNSTGDAVINLPYQFPMGCLPRVGETIIGHKSWVVRRVDWVIPTHNDTTTVRLITDDPL